MAEAFEIRLSQLLIEWAGVTVASSRMQVTPGRTLSAIRTPGQGAVAGFDGRPGLAADRVHCPGDPGQGPRAASGDLIQRPPSGGHRGDQAEQLFLVGQHPEVADHLAAVGDRAGQVGRHPAAVVDQQPRGGQRP